MVNSGVGGHMGGGWRWRTGSMQHVPVLANIICRWQIRFVTEVGVS